MSDGNTSTITESPAAKPDKSHGRFARFRVGVARGSRWFFLVVLLALVPILLSWTFEPGQTSLMEAVAHGELAILAGGIAAGTADIAFGIERASWWKNCTITVSFGIGVMSTGTLAAVVGKAQRLTAAELAAISLGLLAVAIANGLVVIIGEKGPAQ